MNQPNCESLNIEELRIMLGCLDLAESQMDILKAVYRDQLTDKTIQIIRAKLDYQIRNILLENI